MGFFIKDNKNLLILLSYLLFSSKDKISVEKKNNRLCIC